VNEAEEFLEDFGEQALSVADLERLLERARTMNDRDLRVLVKQYQALKRVTGELLERTESTLRGSQSQQNQILKLAHFLIHSDDPGAT
jgi:hypothetical protein